MVARRDCTAPCFYLTQLLVFYRELSLLTVSFFGSNVKIRAEAHKFNSQNFKIMTASFQTAFFAIDANNNINRKSRRSNGPRPHLYQVEVENFDNEIETYEVEAFTAAEAAEIAESRFSGDVYNMNIYDMGDF